MLAEDYYRLSVDSTTNNFHLVTSFILQHRDMPGVKLSCHVNGKTLDIWFSGSATWVTRGMVVEALRLHAARVFPEFNVERDVILSPSH